MEIRHVGAVHMHTAPLGRRMDGLTNLIGAFRDYANVPHTQNTSQRVYHTHPGALNDSGKTQRIWKIWNRTQSSRKWLDFNIFTTTTTAAAAAAASLLNSEFPLRLERRYLKTE